MVIRRATGNPDLNSAVQEFEAALESQQTDMENDMTPEITKQPARKKLHCINAIQLKRLDKLITHFKKREKRLVYVKGQVQSDLSEEVWINFLDRSDSKDLKIVRNAKKLSLDSGLTYGKSFTSSFDAAVNEHSVLDLFHTACRMIPGFEAATARRYQARTPTFVGKAAVKPIPYDGSEPPLVFNPPLLERRAILPSAILNALALGSTGSGKTESFMRPALFSMLAYRLAGGRTASLLVIDPKVELLQGVERRLKEQGELSRLVVVGQCAPIRYFQENDGLTLTDRFERVKKFMLVSCATSEDSRWQAFAEQFLLCFLRDDQQFANVCGLPLLESLATLVTGDKAYLASNQWVALRRLLNFGMESLENLRHMADIYEVLVQCVGMSKFDRPLARYVALKDGDQYFYNARGALSIADGLGSEDAAHLMDFSVRRGLNPGERTDVATLVERGAVLVFQPRDTSTHDLLGGALKSLFFRCTMERRDMLRPMGYFCDEFQRYITFDADTGEHAFLDRCRAYRVNSFLATQSMAALRAASGGGGLHLSSALDSLLVNTPTKVCFRTADETSVATMKSFIPGDAHSGGHVLSFRPPSSLKTGECYFAFGPTWGRTRYRLATP